MYQRRQKYNIDSTITLMQAAIINMIVYHHVVRKLQSPDRPRRLKQTGALAFE
jgi:hypothetical protein